MTLEEFIKIKMESYEEPQRAGTARGETIGMSAETYHGLLVNVAVKMRDKEILKKYNPKQKQIRTLRSRYRKEIEALRWEYYSMNFNY